MSLDELIDRKGLAELGRSRRSIDHLFSVLPVIAYPGQRKVYVRTADVKAYDDEHTYNGRDRVRVA